MNRGYQWMTFADMDADFTSGKEMLLLKMILGSLVLMLTLWGMFLLREVRMHDEAHQGRQACSDWGGAVILILSAALLIGVSDGGCVDRLLARAYWCFLERTWAAVCGHGTAIPGVIAGLPAFSCGPEDCP